MLLTRAGTACDLLERPSTSRPHFDPQREQREFTLSPSDYAVAVFGAAPARAIHAEAPGVRLTFRQVGPGSVDGSGGTLGAVDGLLMTYGVISGFAAVELHRDRWLRLPADDRPELDGAPTLDDRADCPGRSASGRTARRRPGG
ncbi:hypothetical protein ACIQGZ_04395 [Streptomyces sp. NPDC092296]|uniref:hypothetical protein n=1 Tax=Streptomyces sp. NPDC092296 TaxID=3366012 RepID=UPI00380B3ECA